MCFLGRPEVGGPINLLIEYRSELLLFVITVESHAFSEAGDGVLEELVSAHAVRGVEQHRRVSHFAGTQLTYRRRKDEPSNRIAERIRYRGLEALDVFTVRNKHVGIVLAD
jgi:hypothetical protein